MLPFDHYHLQILIMPARLVRHRSIVPAVDREEIKGSYWGTFLGNLLKMLNRCGDARSRCPDRVVPVESFNHASLTEYMKRIDSSVKVCFDF